MRLSVTTDYAADTGDPSPYLERIAEAGFTHLHWCHHWNTDFLYSRWEIEQVQRWMSDYGLALLDLHGSVGPEKNWASPSEYARLAGVDLVRNRLEMTAALGGRVVIMHAPRSEDSLPLRRSLDTLEPLARDAGVRIAVENTHNFPLVEKLLNAYDEAYLGLCYDAGHGNMGGHGPACLDALKHRLISVHLHDNDGKGDLHSIPFTGTADWSQLAGLIARSAYTGPPNLEVVMRDESKVRPEAQQAFLTQAFDAGARLSGMIAEARGEGAGA